MLIQPLLLPVVAVLLLLPVPAFAAATADESGGVVCSETSGICIVEVETAGQQGGPEADESPDRSDSGPAECRDTLVDKDVPCHDPNRGWWDSTQNCYYMRADPAPPVGDAIWQGHTDGAIYVEVCPWVAGAGGMVWRATPPPGMGGITVTPEELAHRAADRLAMAAPEIRMAPEIGSRGLVGLPVWMWTQRSARTWGPLSATASVPGLTVTATARATKVEWDMGDGQTVICRGPGTPYQDQYADQSSPDCGHLYERSSFGQPSDSFLVNATTTWRITWSGGGRSGQFTVTRSSSAPVQIGEMQVLVS